MTATSFILNLSKRMPLFSAEVWNSFVFLILKRFQLSVMQKLSRCVWVLIRCCTPIFFLLCCCEREQKEFQLFEQINAKTGKAKRAFFFSRWRAIIYLLAPTSWSNLRTNVFEANRANTFGTTIYIWWRVTSSLRLPRSFGEGCNAKRSPNFNINRASRWRRQRIQMNLSSRDKTTWVPVKDELWLFLENEVLALATGQTLNSHGWNYLKRGAWLMYLALVIEGVPFVHGAIDLHLRKPHKRTRVFVNPFVKD